MRIGTVVRTGVVIIAVTCGILAIRDVRRLESENAALKAHNNEISHRLAEVLVSNESKERELLAEQNAKLNAGIIQFQHACIGLLEYNQKILVAVEENVKKNLPPLSDLPSAPKFAELLGPGPLTDISNPLEKAEKN